MLLRYLIPERSFYTKKRREVVRLEEEEEWTRITKVQSSGNETTSSPRILIQTDTSKFVKPTDEHVGDRQTEERAEQKVSRSRRVAF